MKIRLHGTTAECEATVGRLGQVLTLLSVSEPYPDRGRSVLVRVYVEADVSAPPVRATAEVVRELPSGGAL